MTDNLSQMPTTLDISREQLERQWRGQVYLARLRLNRLVGAWPTPDEQQRRTVAQQRSIVAGTIIAARRERVTPFYYRGRQGQ